MKKTLIVGIATLGLTLGAYGQGAINIDNGTSLYGPVEDTAGNYYGGPFGLEVWYQNGANDITAINSFNGVNPVSAYALASGWTLAATYTGQDSTGNSGFIQLGALNIPGVSPAGSTITIALAMWTGSGLTFASGPKAGVLAMQVSTSNYNDPFAPPPPDIGSTAPGWDAAGSDLILVSQIPEPTTLALAALGAAALMIRRRK